MPNDKVSSPVERKTAGLNRAGRKKGSVNKTTKAAKEAIAEAFDKLGGTKALVRWSRKNEKEFYTLIWPKIIPLQLSGEDGSPLQVEIVQFSADRSNP